MFVNKNQLFYNDIVVITMQEFHKIIEEICEENNIEFKLLSKDWIIMLEKNKKVKFISGYKFDLNMHGIGNVFDDKYATYEVLKSKNIPIINHKIIFKTTNKNAYATNANSYDIVLEYFKENNSNIVLKANDSTCGNDVYHITNANELTKWLNNLFKKSFSISICPFLKIRQEYRLVILNNECVLAYAKVKPVVIGDGKRTLRDLLIEFNPYYFKNRLENDSQYKKILAKNEKYEYNWQFNLSKGANCYLVDDDLKDRLIDISKKITNCIDLGFCSLDIIENEQNELLVMEINSGVMMKNFTKIVPNGREIAKKIYKDAILSCFK